MQTQETIPLINYIWINEGALVIKDHFDALKVIQNKIIALLWWFFIVRNKVSKLTVSPLGFYISYADNKQKYVIYLIFIEKKF